MVLNSAGIENGQPVRGKPIFSDSARLDNFVSYISMINVA